MIPLQQYMMMQNLFDKLCFRDVSKEVTFLLSYKSQICLSLHREPEINQ